MQLCSARRNPDFDLLSHLDRHILGLLLLLLLLRGVCPAHRHWILLSLLSLWCRNSISLSVVRRMIIPRRQV